METGDRSVREAIFLAALPYRSRLYRRGGWLPLLSHPQSLKEFFTDGEIKRARNEADRTESRARAEKIQCLFLDEIGYPEKLKSIFDPPVVLFVKGELRLNNPIALVGTRRPSPVSRLAIRKYVGQLARKGEVCVVSGFARGLDREAHLCALREGLPGAAVLGSGLFRPGPISNLDILDLASKTPAPFALVSEFPPDMPAFRDHFPRRNRIIAGMCSTICVFQASWKSGAMITARYALEEGRDVAAFDHELLLGEGMNEGARGLLEDGAGRIEPDLGIVRLPPFRLHPDPEQLEFWSKNMISLGNGLFAEEGPS